MAPDVRLIAIADPSVLGRRDLVAAARDAQAGGATMLQLRMKHGAAGAMFQLARRLLDALTIPLYVNDRADVALAAGAHGVHLGAEDVPAAAVRDMADPSFGVGASVGDPTEADLVRGVAVSYWSIGSIFSTATKPDAGRAIGVDGFQRVSALAPPGMPLVAIGGINAERGFRIVRAGAGGVAVISAIFGAEDVQGAARRIREAVDAGLGARDER